MADDTRETVLLEIMADSQESATEAIVSPDWSAMSSPEAGTGRLVVVSPPKPGAYPDWSCMISSPVTPRRATTALHPFRLSRLSPVRCKGPKPCSSASPRTEHKESTTIHDSGSTDQGKMDPRPQDLQTDVQTKKS